MGGCGHIGLPLGVLLALRTQGKVSLYDTNKKNINLINKGVYPYVEENGEKFLKIALSKKSGFIGYINNEIYKKDLDYNFYC